MSKSLEFNRKITEISSPKPKGKRWWQVLLFIYASVIFIDRLHNIAGFKFEHFGASDDQFYGGNAAKKRTFKKGMQALDALLLEMCPIGSTKVDRVLATLRYAGAKCKFLRKGEFLVNAYIPETQRSAFIWSCEYYTNPFLLKGHYRYTVAIYLDSHYKTLGINSGINIYEHFFF